MLTGVSGCRLVQGAADLPGNAIRAMTPGKETEKPADPVLLQQDLFRFTDELSVRFDRAVIDFNREGNEEDFTETDAIAFRLSFRNRLIEIVSGPNAFVNLVDMVFVVTMFEHAVDVYYAPRVLGDPQHEAKAVLVDAKKQVIDLAVSYLGPEQEGHLEEIISEWLQEDFRPADALYSRYRGLTEDLLATQQEDPSKPSSLFGALMLDPLAGLDPTVREIAQVRLLAERGMYVAQRTPPLLRLQMELLTAKMLERPEMQQVLAQTAETAEALDRVSKTAAELPDRISAEREAILNTLNEQNQALTTLVSETNAALTSGRDAIEQANILVGSVDTFLDHLGVYDPPDPNAPPEEPGEPFRIQDYTDALRQLQVSAERVNELANTLDKTLVTATSDEVVTKLESASGVAVAQGQDLVDYAFKRALLLFALCAIIAGGVVVVVRLISGRKAR